MSSLDHSGEKPVFSLGFAHYHGPWEWEYVRQILAEKGYDSIAPDVPIEDPNATLDDLATIYRKAQEEKGAENYVEVAHSFWGDIAYRKIGKTPISQMINIATPLMPVLKKKGLPEKSILHNGRTVLYASFLSYEKAHDGIAEFDPKLISDAFYNDISDETLKALAIGSLRQHPHVPQPEDDSNAVLPADIPQYYIGLLKDNAFKYENQVQTARFLNMSYSELKTGHFPMLSRPDLVVSELLRIVEVEEKKHLKGVREPEAVLV